MPKSTEKIPFVLDAHDDLIWHPKEKTNQNFVILFIDESVNMVK